MELYSILLAVHLLGHSNKSGTIYTDYLEAVSVANNPLLFRNMGRKTNLPIYELLLNTLSKFPDIRLAFVKAHGPIKKQQQWTTQQWGKYHADRIAKNIFDSFSLHHIHWPIQHLEDLVKLYPSWHWVAADGHLALEPLKHVLNTISYMIQRVVTKLRAARSCNIVSGLGDLEFSSVRLSRYVLLRELSIWETLLVES